jgi:hypothetical protein
MVSRKQENNKLLISNIANVRTIRKKSKLLSYEGTSFFIVKLFV